MVKKHKCASSTFLGVITAYQLWRGITTEPPVFGAMAGAYPAPFDSRFRVRPTYEGVSFKEHSVNNPNFMPNAFRVTTVREPTSHFFSVFNYFYYRHDEDKLYVAPGTPHSNNSQYSECGCACFGKPFTDLLDQSKVLPGAFLERLDDEVNFDFDTTPWSFRIRNFQAFEMNINDGLRNDEDIISEVTEKLTGFDHLHVTDRWLESLVIMALQLNIPIEYLLLPNRKVAEEYPRGPLTLRQMSILKKNYRIDYLIYEVSNQLLDAKIDGEFVMIKVQC